MKANKMKDFIHHQLHVSEQLFTLMRDDHRTRMAELVHWSSVNASLIKKLEDRDSENKHLRQQVNQLKTAYDQITQENYRLRTEIDRLSLDLGLKNG